MTRNTKSLRVLVAGWILVSVNVAHVAVAQGFPDKAIKGQIEKNLNSNVYLLEAADAITKLQSWYVPETGVYKTTAWWNFANAMTVLADFSKISGSKLYLPILQNTLFRAQKAHPGFLNHFYDDEGWWALAWIDAYDATNNQQYLSMAQSIFEDMAAGWDTAVCGGGIWWNKDRKYKNAIANELFLSVAARLAIQVSDPAQKSRYLGWARTEWQWFSQSGMINRQQLINDGLNSSDPSHCVNNGQAVWSYNQGVVLGGLAALSRAEHADPTLLAAAKAIADAALLHLTDANGVLHDPGEAKGGAGGGGVQFKGIFVRNLMKLEEKLPQPQYSKFFTANANSIWSNARGPEYQLGQIWSGPFDGASAGSQSSALDALIAEAQSVYSRRVP